MEIGLKWIALLCLLLCTAVNSTYADEEETYWLEEEISFATGDFTLYGVLVKPEGSGPFPVVIFIHGDGPINRTMLGYYEPIWGKFVKAGYACISWDKPGIGKSTGTFGDGTLFHDRASIAAGAVSFLKAREDIDGKRIGLWGISQAGYIMPMLTTISDDISFMIAVSSPGMNSIAQGAYFIKKQLISEGVNNQVARKFADYYTKSKYAKSYEEYRKYVELLGKQPYLKKTGWAEIKPKDRYAPLQTESESFFNPVTVLEEITFPVLAIFGEKDTQIPPQKSAEEYRKALHKAGNEHFKVIMFSGADHVVFNTITGSLKEWEDKFRNQQMDYTPEYLDTMAEWLKGLFQ
ncbi:alpha/beta hydrolase family protein [Candidatus Latescibacterota bacterium]